MSEHVMPLFKILQWLVHTKKILPVLSLPVPCLTLTFPPISCYFPLFLHSSYTNLGCYLLNMPNTPPKDFYLCSAYTLFFTLQTPPQICLSVTFSMKPVSSSNCNTLILPLAELYYLSVALTTSNIPWYSSLIWASLSVVKWGLKILNGTFQK